MQNLSQTLKQDLLPVIEWGSPSDTELQHAADRIRDVAPPEMVDITWPIPPRFPLSQSAYANMHFITDQVTDTSHTHSSLILFVCINKIMRSGRSRQWAHERAVPRLTSIGTYSRVKTFLDRS